MPDDLQYLEEKLQALEDLLKQDLERQWSMQGTIAGAAAASDRQLQQSQASMQELGVKLEEMRKDLVGPLKSIQAREEAEAAAVRARTERWNKLMKPTIVVPLVALIALVLLIWGGRVTLQSIELGAPGVSFKGTQEDADAGSE